MSIIACSNDDSDKKNDEVVTITPLGNSQRYFDNGLTFTSQSGSENIEFTCNGDWNVSVANTIGGETSVAMLQSSKAYALLQGRDFVTPEDIKFVAPYVLQHRLILTAEAEMEGYSPVKVTQRLIDKVEVPK